MKMSDPEAETWRRLVDVAIRLTEQINVKPQDIGRLFQETEDRTASGLSFYAGPDRKTRPDAVRELGRSLNIDRG